MTFLDIPWRLVPYKPPPSPGWVYAWCGCHGGPEARLQVNWDCNCSPLRAVDLGDARATRFVTSLVATCFAHRPGIPPPICRIEYGDVRNGGWY